tara:strand:+ start:44 stop:505 length:462 start_codon:yes stop_codon:yes gene_type:complete
MKLIQLEKQAYAEREIAKDARISVTNQNPFYAMAKNYNQTDKNKGIEGSGLKNKELAAILEEMAEMAEMRCHYTGMLLTLKCREANKLSFDRIDNSIGHRPDNIVITSATLNYARRDTSYDVFVNEILPSFIDLLMSSPKGRERRAKQEGWGQ